MPTKPGTGSVTLVGAGPGDPELLTLRAVRALQSADVILIDDLVAPAILDFARREAKKMMVGKTGFAPSCRQDEINALMVSLAKAGTARGAAQGRRSDDLRPRRRRDRGLPQGRIPVEVVPGISAAQGAASRLGVSLTHRKLARRIQYVTAHGADGKLPSDIDWASVADPVTTTVVYMPSARWPSWRRRRRPAGFRRIRRRSPWSRRRGRIRKSSPARSPTSPRGSTRRRRSVRCWS